MDRRTFLMASSALAAGATLTREAVAKEPANPVNTKLQSLEKKLRASKEVAHVFPLYQENPTHGMVHWSHIHFGPAATLEDIASIEKIQMELVTCMARLMDDKELGFKQVLAEGYEQENVKQQLEACKGVMRTCVASSIMKPFREVEAFMEFPSPAQIERNMKSLKHLSEPCEQVVGGVDADGFLCERKVQISALGLLCAHTILSQTKGLEIVPGEDHELRNKAKVAHSIGTEADRKTSVDERDAFLVRIIKKSRSPIVHVFFGAGHRFDDDTKRENVSLLVIRSKGVQRFLEADKPKVSQILTLPKFVA